jgi:Tfp pilus assembly protein PilV
MKLQSVFKKEKGVGLLEILIASVVIVIGLLAIISFLIFSRGITFRVARNTEATSFAEEAIEAVRSMRDESWSSVSTPGTYYPEIVGNKWTLSVTDPGLLNNLYTRTVVIGDVQRDANDDISSSGASDSNTKKITATVSWQESSSNRQVVLTTYITNFVGN